MENEKKNTDFYLEKLKIHDRVSDVESTIQEVKKSVEDVRVAVSEVKVHISEGQKNRDLLMAGFSKLEAKIDKVDEVMFGSEDNAGVVHQLKNVTTIATNVLNILGKIFVAVVIYIIIQLTPSVLSGLSKVIHG